MTQKEIKTITPAVLSKVKGKSPELNLRISTKIRGGYKVLARKGRSTQEVFIITELERSELDRLIRENKPGKTKNCYFK